MRASMINCACLWAQEWFKEAGCKPCCPGRSLPSKAAASKHHISNDTNRIKTEKYKKGSCLGAACVSSRMNHLIIVYSLHYYSSQSINQSLKLLTRVRSNLKRGMGSWGLPKKHNNQREPWESMCKHPCHWMGWSAIGVDKIQMKWMNL